MKTLITLFTASVLIISCSDQPSYVWKYKEGQLVYVKEEAFVVTKQPMIDSVYELQKFNCKEKYCMFNIKESEIISHE